MHIDGKLGIGETIFGRDFEFLKGLANGSTAKLTIPSPSMVHYRGGRAAIDESVYPEMDSFWDDLTAAYREQVRRVGELGCTYLQFDDTSLAYLNDPSQREMLAALGNDAEHLHEAYISHINEALSERPEGMSVTTHMCRGNFRSSWVARAATTSSPRRCSTSSTSTASSWSGTTPARAASSRCASCPRARSSCSASSRPRSGELENRDLLLRRIEEASQYVDIDQLCLSPQCGFSSTVEGNVLSREQQADKLRLIVEVADEVWGT